MAVTPEFDALRAESEHLRCLFQQAPGFIAVLAGPDCVIEMANEAFFEVVGRRDIIGKPLFAALPEARGQGYEEILRTVLASGKPYVGQGARVTLPRAGGVEDRYVDFVYQPVMGAAGEVESIFVQGHDVTERRKAQEAKELVDQRLRQGLEIARMTVWDWDLVTGEVTFSDNAAAVFGCVGLSVDAIRACVHPDDSARLEAAVGAAVAECGSYSVVHRLVRPDTGRIVWINSRGQVSRGPDGAARWVRGVSLDVTERRRAELELERVNLALAERVRLLAEAERRQAFQLEVTDRLRKLEAPGDIFRAVCALLARHLDACRVVCGDYDAEQGLVSFHSCYPARGAAELCGTFPVASFGAANFASLESGATWVSNDIEHDPRTSGADIWPVFRSQHIRSGIAVPLNRKGAMIACLFVNDDRVRVWNDDDIALVQDCAGRMWAAVERVRAEEALRQADVRKDEFLAMLAHELRNPLAPISAAAELLRIGRLDRLGIERTSQVIARQVGHMTGLVNDLLDVSRVTRGLVELARDNIDTHAVVADAVEQIRPLIEARGHTLRLALAPEPACVTGDHKRLVQVLSNLLGNAAKYTPDGGAIEVRSTVEDGQVCLAVADNGIGIGADMLPHVFELFAQARRTPDRSLGGLGLGLALVKSLVELHGGSVHAHSDGMHAGSLFSVRLPRVQCANREAADTAPGGALRAGQPLRLLVVDDNADAAFMLRLLLEGAGYEVAVEHEAERALALARTARFDAFLLDIGLPGADGRELAERLRREPNADGALLVAITGYGQQCDRASALASGFDDFFVKPVDLEALAAALTRAGRPAACPA